MNYYVQYHNADERGLPFASPPFSGTWLGIRTGRPGVLQADGVVFLIVGLGRPRRYFLWETFRIQDVERLSNGQYQASGEGWQLAPPAELRGAGFDAFKSACANFIGFREINDLPFCRTLIRLAEGQRSPGDPRKIVKALRRIEESIAGDAIQRAAAREALGQYTAVRALSIRQPHAEAIMRGVKKIEYRSGPTNVRERIFVYAAQGRYSADEEATMMKTYRIKDVACDDLPRGVLVGSVELYDCDGGDWLLRRPERAAKLVAPTQQPQPIWFYPF
ncbi:MAG: ASCH domain-containing protein [Planctomycetes bacterium]|nr:ASCH domain-containing protein [Planctomycetota bacterium]